MALTRHFPREQSRATYLANESDVLPSLLQRQVYRLCYSIGIGGVLPVTSSARGRTVLCKTRESVVDPVCGEEIDPTEVAYVSKVHGVTYHFCCVNCQLDFEEAPEKYIGPYA